MHVFCRKVFAIPFHWALLAAILFTLSNGMTIHSSRIQLATVAFAPVMALLMWSAIKAFIKPNALQFIIWSGLAALLFGAWCMTCFYVAWFFVFFLTAFTIVILVISGIEGMALLRSRITSQPGSFLFAVCAAVICLVPFVYTYLPKSLEVGVRPYWTAVFVHTVPLEGILQVGRDNILFGPLYNDLISYLPGDPVWRDDEYYDTGFTIPLVFLFVCGCFYVMKTRREIYGGAILQATVIATVATWLLALNLFGYSAWFLVYELFPGARALAVVSAYQVLLALPVAIIAVKYLSMRRMRAWTAIFVAAILIVSEFNRPYLALDRAAEMARISVPQAPPSDCRAFYVSGWKGQEEMPGYTDAIRSWYSHNVTAMLIAQEVGIPTINGIASFNPPDWNFGNPNAGDYDQRVRVYAEKYHITSLCRLDLNTKQWSPVNSGTS